MRRRGFTLVELMLGVTIVGLLAALASTELQAFVMRAKRTEAIIALENLWTAQRAFYGDKGVYASSFAQLDFEVSGGEHLSPTEYRGQRYTYQLSQPWGPTSFYCLATAQLDNDPWPDIVEIYEVPGE
jgi:prepilin-type N-terminal cleavage/methylation domain-containing protein